MPSWRACFASGPPVASIPPYMIASGFAPLIFVRIARKSIALSLVASRDTTFIPAAFAAFSNSVARPWPYAVESSTTATVLMPRFFAAYIASAGPCCASVATTR